MNKRQFVKLLEDPDVEKALGRIMMKAFNQAMERDIKVEVGQPGGPPVIEEKRWHILDFIAHYLPQVEGAIRGAQADSAKAHNATARVAMAITEHMKTLSPVSQMAVVAMQMLGRGEELQTLANETGAEATDIQ